MLLSYHEQTHISLVSLVILLVYIRFYTCVLHLVNLTFRNLISLQSLQVNFSFPISNASFHISLLLQFSRFSWNQFPTLSDAISPSSLPKYPSTLCLLFIRPAFYCGLLGICTAITIFLLLPSPLLFIKHFLYVWNFSKSFTCTASFTPNCFWNACGHSHNCSHFLKEKTKFRQTVKFTWHKFIWLENGELGP